MARQTIGLFVDQLVYEYHADFWQGVCKKAEEKKINLVTYVGSTLVTGDSNAISLNKIFSLVSKKRIDGAITLISSLASRVNQTEKEAFVKMINSICPTVVVGDIMPEYHSIAVDNRSGMFDAIDHLIKKHNKKRIAFIGGPKSSAEANERFFAYKDALKANDILFDEKLFFEGHFLFESGQEAIQYYVENSISFDAVAAASDWMAFGAMQELNKRNIAIPDQVTLTGFDNVEAAYVSNPPMASVRQPVVEMGEKAIELIVDVINEIGCEKKIIYPTEFVSRDSCGCLLSEENTKSYEFSETVNEKKIEEKSNSLINTKFSKIQDELTNKLFADISSPGKNEFLHLFNTDLEFVKNSEDISDYHALIAEMRKLVFTSNSFADAMPDYIKKIQSKKSLKHQQVEELLNYYRSFNKRLEENLHKASLLVARKAEQLQFIKHLDSNNQNSEIIRIGQNILTNYTKEDLYKVITNNFPVIDITSCSLVSYIEQNVEMAPEPSRMMFHFDNHDQIKVDYDEFDPAIILPDKYWPEDGDKAWRIIIASMVTDNKPVGYVVYKSFSIFGQIFETFSSEIANALRGINIYEERKRVAALIEEKSQKLTELVTPMMESILELSGVSDNEISTIKQLSGMTESGLSNLKESTDIIGKATMSINEMLQMVDMIEDISSNINILALNASIESARAGTYGLGFQVIAEEIKQLSDTTAKNTKSIADALKRVVKNIDESNEASIENYKVFQNVKDQVDTVTHFLTNVADKMNQLSATSVEILEEIQ